MNGSAVRDRLTDIVATILEVPPELVTDDFSAASSENWDSVRHLNLVLAVEDAFGVLFDEKEIAGLNSFAALLRSLEAQVGR
jgi:acyl carrier protein